MPVIDTTDKEINERTDGRTDGRTVCPSVRPSLRWSLTHTTRVGRIAGSN